MLKVIFSLQRLHLKLNNIKCQIIAKKDSYTIELTPLLTITNGQVNIQSETQFLIVQNDPRFHLQVTLVLQGAKKLGGEHVVNLTDWDQNLRHSTEAQLQMSPDRHAQISYTFLYIRKNYPAIEKTLILCSEYRDIGVAEMETKKRELTRKQNRLEDQIKKLKEENLIMHTSEQIRKQQITTKKIEHDQKIKNFQQSIQETNSQNNSLKKKNDQIIKMIQLYGKEQTKKELREKYPQKMAEDQSQAIANAEIQLEENIKTTKNKHKAGAKIGSWRETCESSTRGERERSRERAIRNLKVDEN